VRIDPAYTVRAHNTATRSENKIHDDTVAAAFGFAGGLVPGVDVYAYLTRAPVERWGLDWLRGGSITARFRTPVYDGDEVAVHVGGDDPSMDLELRDGKGQVCATGTAALGPQAGDSLVGEPISVQAPPNDPPEATPDSLRAGTVLGAVTAEFDRSRAGDYLAAVRETSTLYADHGIAHPGWLLRFANSVLVANVRLGPWIHVASDVRLLGLVGDGDTVEARARVTDEYERKGHRFVTLDVALTAGGRPVQRIAHTAIYRPRRPGV
jgi:acyl dehydratase